MPNATPIDMASLTGAEFLQLAVEGRIPSAPVAITLGFSITAVEKGRVELKGSA